MFSTALTTVNKIVDRTGRDAAQHLFVRVYPLTITLGFANETTYFDQ